MLSPDFIEDKNGIVEESAKIMQKCIELNDEIRKSFIGKK